MTRSTTSKDVQGNSEDRRRRKEWLVETYRADVDVRLFPIWATVENLERCTMFRLASRLGKSRWGRESLRVDAIDAVVYSQ